MADPATVKRALHALAYGNHAEQTDGRPPPRAVISEASEALVTVADAATFCEQHGLARLQHAVRVATDRGDTARAARGREALDTLTAYRRAAAGDGGEISENGPSARPDVDHFHSGRGTTLPGAGQRSDR